MHSFPTPLKAALAHVQFKTIYPFLSVSKVIVRLEALGIVKEITGKERNRVYSYDGFLRVLNREG
jgi:Fic family protein